MTAFPFIKVKRYYGIIRKEEWKNHQGRFRNKAAGDGGASCLKTSVFMELL